MSTRALVACVVALLVALSSPAAAEDASAEEVRALARAAQDDPAALERLRAIDSIEGTPVDLRAALEGAAGDELDARLQTLAGDAAGVDTVDSTEARAAARSVLDQDKFQESDIPRPFKGVLDEIGDRLRPIGDWLGELLNDVSGGRPGLALAVLLLIGALVAAFFARKVIARRARRASAERRHDLSVERLSAAELEGQADAAELRGDLEAALRLRFRAGLSRLVEARVVPPRASLTSGELQELLRSKEFEEVAATFDEVVYGRRPPRADDLERSRAGWRALLAARTRR